MTPTPRPMFLVAELRNIRDPALLLRYREEVEPVMNARGGEILGVSATGAELVEGEGAPALTVIHRWVSRAAFDELWNSPEYQPIKALRHAACDSRITVFEA